MKEMSFTVAETKSGHVLFTGENRFYVFDKEEDRDEVIKLLKKAKAIRHTWPEYEVPILVDDEEKEKPKRKGRDKETEEICHRHGWSYHSDR